MINLGLSIRLKPASCTNVGKIMRAYSFDVLVSFFTNKIFVFEFSAIFLEVKIIRENFPK